MHQPNKFWDRVAESYAKKPVRDEAAYQKKLQVTRGHLRPDMDVLEFGCGTGSTAIAHAPYVKHIQAIDISSRMIEIARGKAEAGNLKNVTFTQSDISEFSVPDQTFDAVLGLVFCTSWKTRKRPSPRFIRCSNRGVFSSPAQHALEIR